MWYVKFIKGALEVLAVSPGEVGAPARSCFSHYWWDLIVTEGSLHPKGCSKGFVSVFLILITSDISAGKFCILGGCLVHCRIFRTISGLQMPVASHLVMTTNSIIIIAKCSRALGVEGTVLSPPLTTPLRTTVLYKLIHSPKQSLKLRVLLSSCYKRRNLNREVR